MRYQRIALKHFRGIEEVELDFADGITVVEGPNEIGKSSIAEALELIRRYRSNSKHKDVLAVQPVDRDEGPEIELTLQTGPYNLTYRQRWIRRPMSELTVHSPKPESHTGEQAHQRFLDILSSTADIKLLEMLNTKQGESLVPPAGLDSTALRQALDRSTSPVHQHEALMQAAEQEYLSHFTKARGAPTGRYKEAKDAVEACQTEFDRLRKASQEMEDLASRQATLAQEVEQLARQRDQAKAELEECKLGQSRLKELAEAKEKAQEELRQATAAGTKADSALAERQKAKEQLEKLNAQAEQLSAKAKELVESKAKAEAALADAEAELDRATKAKQTATQAAASAQATERACAVQAGLTKLKEQIEQARQALSELNAATSQVKAARIDDADIERLNKLQGELDKATAAQSAAAARVVVRRLGDASVSLDGTELEPEGQTEVRATDVVRIEAPGVAAIEVHPGLPSEQIDQQVNQASKALASALAKLDVSSLSEAQESATTRKNAKTQADAAKLKLTGILALATNQDPDSAIVQKEEELAGLEAEWEELHANHPDLAGAGQEQLKELTTKASQARDAAKQAEQDAAKAQKHLNAAKDTAAEARLAPVKTQTQADAATEAATKAATNLDNARQQASDADLATAAAKAEARLNAAKQQATQTAKAHKEAETDLEHRQRGAESAHEEANKAWHTAHTDLTSTNARLDTLAGQDTYEKQSDAAAALTAAHRNLTRLDRQADAARLLRATLLRHQAQTHQRYAPQFAEHLDRLAAAVFGPDCRIHLNDQLVITERTLAGRTVSFTSLSKGTQEQLALLSRLACAELIDPADGAPIVLDDTLGFADPDRLSALTDLLAHANAQVLLLTCQPARFANIPGARRVHLPNPQTHPAEHGT